MKKKPVMLIILDGYGLSCDTQYNAAKLSSTPTLDYLFKTYPHSQILASGEVVGLPEGQMGNSEVGHLNIGSGRIVYQDLTRISNSIESGDFFENENLLKSMDDTDDRALHLVGLLSPGGVHSHRSHLFALMKMAKDRGVKNLYIHPILDGRDVPPDLGLSDIKLLQEKIEEIGIGKIATVSGRYYAMDRDKRWERTKLAYDALVHGEGKKSANAIEVVEKSYSEDVFDEFIIPTVIIEDEEPIGKITSGDNVVFFNFRPDRAKQIVRALADDDFDSFDREIPFKGNVTTLTQYDITIPNVEVAFTEDRIENTLGEYLSSLGLKQLRIAETEKYAHVTSFFNGGREVPYTGEERILIPSPKVATYDLKPEMSAYEVTQEVIKNIESDKYDFIVLNYANCDMVGHTGVLEAAIKAVEAVDTCLKKILDTLKEKGGVALVTADHGNCEKMALEDGSIVTSHTTNPVPLILYNGSGHVVDGILADLAPTILELMELNKPEEMTGHSLLEG